MQAGTAQIICVFVRTKKTTMFILYIYFYLFFAKCAKNPTTCKRTQPCPILVQPTQTAKNNLFKGAQTHAQTTPKRKNEGCNERTQTVRLPNTTKQKRNLQNNPPHNNPRTRIRHTRNRISLPPNEKRLQKNVQRKHHNITLNKPTTKYFNFNFNTLTLTLIDVPRRTTQQNVTQTQKTTHHTPQPNPKHI